MTTEEIVQEKSKIFMGQMLEHVDSVRVFVTFHNGEKDATGSFTTGGGNFYAQFGLIGEWLTRQNEIARQQVKDNE